MMDFWTKHRYTILLIGIFVLALGCRVIRYYECDQLERDTFSYLHMAQHWAQEKSILAAYDKNINGYLSCPPLLPGVMALGEICGVGALTAGLWLNLFCGAVIPLLIYGLALAIFRNRQLSIYAALLAAVQPFALRLSALVMRDTPFVAAIILALTCGVWAVRTGRLRYWAGFGIGAVLASWCRKEGPELIVVFACWCGWELWQGRTQWRAAWGRTFKAAGCVLTIFILGTMPLQIYLVRHSDCEWDIFNFDLLKVQYQKIMKSDFSQEYQAHQKP